MSNRYSLNKLVVTATFLAVVAAAPLWATEYKPATEECKACVTRCVMNETGGKVFDAGAKIGVATRAITLLGTLPVWVSGNAAAKVTVPRTGSSEKTG